MIEKKFLTTVEAAEYISCKLSYFYRLVSARKFPSYKPNNCRTYFLQSDLDNYLMAGRRCSANEVEDLAAESISRGKK